MWLFDRLLSASVSYDAPVSARITGPLNLVTLDSAAGFLLARHDSLRTRFPCQDWVPRQVIAAYLRQRTAVVDLTGLSAAGRARELPRLLAQVARRPFDLAAGPLCWPLVIRLAPDDHVLILAVHHLVADLWSVSLMVSELSAGYQRAAQGRPGIPRAAAQAADLAIRPSSRLTPQRLDRLRGYWRRQLSGSRSVPMPTDHPRPRRAGLGSRVHEAALDLELSQALRALAAGRGVTLFVLLLAALSAMIRRWTGHHDLVTVSVTAGRRGRAAEQVVGMLTECLVVRTVIAGDPSFGDYLVSVRDAVLDAFDHSRLPFADIVAVADPGRDLEPSPLRQIGFSLHNTPRPPLADTGLRISGLPADRDEIGISEADLWLEVFDDGEGELLLRLQMDDRLFEPGSVRLTVGRYRTLLQAAVRQPETRLSELPLIGPEELSLLASWSRGGAGTTAGVTYGGPPVDGSVRDWLEAAVRRAPDQVAATAGGGHLTYQALAGCARRLARQARQAGIGPGELIQVQAQNPVAWVTGALAAMHLGAVVVCGAPRGHGPVLRTTLRTASRGRPAGAFLEVSCVSSSRGPWPLAPVFGDSLACAVVHHGELVGYSHRTLLTLAVHAASRLGALAREPVLVPAGPESGPAALMLLLSGQPIVVADGLAAIPGQGAADHCRAISAGAGTLAQWLSAGWAVPRGIAVLTDASLSAATARALHGAGAEIWVRHAPADPPGWVTASRLRFPLDGERGLLGYGAPLSVPGIWLRDQAGDLVPAGAAGEICLGGEMVPWGFIGRPGLTAERLVPDPRDVGGRVWRTGERARFRWDGVLEPVPVRAGCFELNGYWVDRAEVTSVLSALPGVREAAVGLRPVPRDGGVVVSALVAFIAMNHDGCPAAEEVLEFVTGRLPWYAVPSVIARVDVIARHPDGAADFRQFPAPGHVLPPRRLAPATHAGRLVADLIASVLGVNRVHDDDNFFRLGGTSMDAVRLCGALRARFDVDIPLYDMVTAPTLAGITQTVAAARRAAEERA
jgi:non-ribosomal peptide synthetase component F/acyl carrier protein